MLTKKDIGTAMARIQLEFPDFPVTPARAEEWLRELAKVPQDVLDEAISRINRSQKIRSPRLADVSGHCYRILANRVGHIADLATAEAQAIQVSRSGDAWAEEARKRGPAFEGAYRSCGFHRYGQLTDDFARTQLLSRFRGAFQQAVESDRDSRSASDLAAGLAPQD